MGTKSDYVAGTITVTQGSVDFTGTDTLWRVMGFQEGDTVLLKGYQMVIDAGNVGSGLETQLIASNTNGKFTEAWPGETGTFPYRMRYQSNDSRLSAKVSDFLLRTASGNITAIGELEGIENTLIRFTGPGTVELIDQSELIDGVKFDAFAETLADRAAYDGQAQGFTVFVADVGDGRSAIYVKQSNTLADWSDPAYITGPVGPAAPITVGTTTTTPPGTNATVNNSGTPTAPILDFGIPAGKGFYNEGDYNPTETYFEGSVVQYNGSSWIAKQETTGNPPPVLPVTNDANWQLLAQTGSGGDMYKSAYDPTGQNKDIFAEINTKFDTPTGTTAQYIQGDGTLQAKAGLPVSTATQTALDTKANLSGAVFTGTVSARSDVISSDPRQTATPGQINNGGTFTSGFTDAPYCSRFVVQEIVGSTVRCVLEVRLDANNQAFFLFGANGSLAIPGTLSKGGGTFLIDHPLDPFNRNLRHGFVEAPRYDLIYRGTVQLVNGRATVDIDAASKMTAGTFAALTTNAVVTSLQNQNGFARLKPGPINGGSFEIICEDEACTDLVSWVVIAERNDPFVKSDLDQNTDSDGRFVPEFEKEYA